MKKKNKKWWDKKKSLKVLQKKKEKKKYKSTKKVQLSLKCTSVRTLSLLLAILLLQVALPTGWKIRYSTSEKMSWCPDSEILSQVHSPPPQAAATRMEWESRNNIPNYNILTPVNLMNVNSRRRVSSRLANKRIRTVNGNRVNNMKIVHWNLGSRRWENKTDDIEALINEMEVDMCFISEANLWSEVPDHERHIPGFHLIYPDTMDHNEACTHHATGQGWNHCEQNEGAGYWISFDLGSDRSWEKSVLDGGRNIQRTPPTRTNGRNDL